MKERCKLLLVHIHVPNSLVYLLLLYGAIGDVYTCTCVHVHVYIRVLQNFKGTVQGGYT